MTHCELEEIRERYGALKSRVYFHHQIEDFLREDVSRLFTEIHQLRIQLDNAKLDNQRLQSRLK